MPLLFVIPSPANAEKPPAHLLVQSAYSQLKDLSADFVQSTYVEVLDKKITEPGKFYMKKPGKLRIEYTGEHPKLYISDGKKLWIVDKEFEQVETFKVGDGTIPKEALAFLNGLGNMEELFTIKPWRTEKTTKGHIYLKLTPKARDAQYKWLYCEFDDGGIMKKTVIHNKSGNISTYVFNNIAIDQGANDALFKK